MEIRLGHRCPAWLVRRWTQQVSQRYCRCTLSVTWPDIDIQLRKRKNNPNYCGLPESIRKFSGGLIVALSSNGQRHLWKYSKARMSWQPNQIHLTGKQWNDAFWWRTAIKSITDPAPVLNLQHCVQVVLCKLEEMEGQKNKERRSSN